MASYRIRRDELTGRAVVVRDSDGATIPKDPRNADYRAYLDWRSGQASPPDDADGPPPPQPPPPKGVAALQAILDQAAATPAGRAALARLRDLALIRLIQAEPEAARAIARAAGFEFDPREG